MKNTNFVNPYQGLFMLGHHGEKTLLEMTAINKNILRLK
jgi:hypothetical protein